MVKIATKSFLLTTPLKSHHFLLFWCIHCSATPDISSSIKNIKNAVYLSRLSFCFLWRSFKLLMSFLAFFMLCFYGATNKTLCCFHPTVVGLQILIPLHFSFQTTLCHHWGNRKYSVLCKYYLNDITWTQMWQVSCRRQGMLTQGPAPDSKFKLNVWSFLTLPHY